MADDIEKSETALCYLPAAKVTSPAGSLAELELLTAEGERFGNVEGVVIDAAARKARYLDVKASGLFRRRRLLLEVGQLAQLDLAGKALRLRPGVETRQVTGIDPARLREFSDDDLLTVLFTPRAA